MTERSEEWEGNGVKRKEREGKGKKGKNVLPHIKQAVVASACRCCRGPYGL